MVKKLPVNEGDAGDASASPGLEDPLEKEMATLLQYSHLGNPRDRGAWRAAVHRATESQARLSN